MVTAFRWHACRRGRIAPAQRIEQHLTESPPARMENAVGRVLRRTEFAHSRSPAGMRTHRSSATTVREGSFGH